MLMLNVFAKGMVANSPLLYPFRQDSESEMTEQLQQLLERIETDMGEPVGRQFMAVAARYFEASRRADRPVSTRRAPAELEARLKNDFPPEGTEIADVLAQLERDVVAESNWLYHPRYMGHQVSAPLPAAVWTDAVIGALNQSLAVQEMSPAITMIEHQLIGWFGRLAGFSKGAGTLTSGGTEATFTALLAARAALMPRAWEDGLEPPFPVVLCGEHAHYAVTRAVGELGLGLKRAVAIRSRDFRMDTTDLAARLKQFRAENTPVMAVVATAGSTPTGSFDDLRAIADICDEYNVWLHVDGAHGASALLSPTRTACVAGIERARSIAWDPHKMMLLPLSVGLLLMRDAADLDNAFQQKAPYLFHGAPGARNWDQGGRSFMCSRRSDALKLWVALQRYGTRAFGLLYDHLSDLTDYLHSRLESHADFAVLHRPECNILCFRYARDSDDEFNLRLRTTYNTRGAGWITTTVLNGVRVLRVTVMNPRTTEADLDGLVNDLSETGRMLAAEISSQNPAAKRS
jgi:L-2,4-diaminobutyrate decarboxylase